MYLLASVRQSADTLTAEPFDPLPWFFTLASPNLVMQIRLTFDLINLVITSITRSGHDLVNEVKGQPNYHTQNNLNMQV